MPRGAGTVPGAKEQKHRSSGLAEALGFWSPEEEAVAGPAAFVWGAPGCARCGGRGSGGGGQALTPLCVKFYALCVAPGELAPPARD